MNNTTNSWEESSAENEPLAVKIIAAASDGIVNVTPEKVERINRLLRDTERKARAECIEIIKSRWLSSSSMKDEILSALSKE